MNLKTENVKPIIIVNSSHHQVARFNTLKLADQFAPEKFPFGILEASHAGHRGSYVSWRANLPIHNNLKI